MTVWMVRAGRYGEREQSNLDENIIAIGWDEIGNISKFKNKEELRQKYFEIYQDKKKMQTSMGVGQLWNFVHEIKKDDIVALPLKIQSAIAIGIVEGEYEYQEKNTNFKHFRRVKWLNKAIPRTKFDQDILYSLGALMTVCRIVRPEVEKRIMKLIKPDVHTEISLKLEGEEEYAEKDMERSAEDQILRYLEAKFKGHGFARIVNAILLAQGYVTNMSPPGPDGGVDILAIGKLGAQIPPLCVQVKSGSSQIGASVLRELSGMMPKYKAEQGLLVAWGGINAQCEKEAKEAFFSIRIWNQQDLLEEIFKHYENFDEELKAELHLKRIWVLVSEEET